MVYKQLWSCVYVGEESVQWLKFNENEGRLSRGIHYQIQLKEWKKKEEKLLTSNNECDKPTGKKNPSMSS